MELSYQLAEQLIALEQQAAQCAALLDDAPPEVVLEVIEAFAPMPTSKGVTRRQRERWSRFWIDWVISCGDRWEQRPTGPAAGDLEELIMRWCASGSVSRGSR